MAISGRLRVRTAEGRDVQLPDKETNLGEFTICFRNAPTLLRRLPRTSYRPCEAGFARADAVDAELEASSLLSFGVFGLGLLQDRDVGVGATKKNLVRKGLRCISMENPR